MCYKIIIIDEYNNLYNKNYEKEQRLIRPTTPMNLENITLRERGQIQKATYSVWFR